MFGKLIIKKIDRLVKKSNIVRHLAKDSKKCCTPLNRSSHSGKLNLQETQKLKKKEIVILVDLIIAKNATKHQIAGSQDPHHIC